MPVYGWRINPDIEDPAGCVEYLADAAGMTPAALKDDGFDYGSWENAFFMPKPCMLRYDTSVAYYLDPNDYSRKLDGTASDISNPDFDGNAMMEWGLLWYKFGSDGTFYVSNRQQDDSYKCWCNYNSRNEITSHFYTAIYNSIRHGTRMRSLSGYKLTTANGVGDLGSSDFYFTPYYCRNNKPSGSEPSWFADLYSDRMLINALLVLMGKSLDTQAVFGNGLTSKGSYSNARAAVAAYETGTLDNAGLFYGTRDDYTTPVKVFGMENWWGCTGRYLEGILDVNGQYCTKLTYTTIDGTSLTGFETENTQLANKSVYQTAWHTIGGESQTTGNSDLTGNIRSMEFTEYGYAPGEITGSDYTIYYADYAKKNAFVPSGTSGRMYYVFTGGVADRSTNSQGRPVNGRYPQAAGAFTLESGLESYVMDEVPVSANLSCKPLFSAPAPEPPEAKEDDKIYIFDMETPQNGFGTHGLAKLNPISCKITEALNGEYSLTMQHPKDPEGKWQFLREWNIVKALGQLFVINKVTENTSGTRNGRITVWAEHITYQLNDFWLFPGTPLSDAAVVSGQALLNNILKMIDYDFKMSYYQFTAATDIDVPQTFHEWDSLESGATPYAMILGSNGFISRFGGELYRDNFYFSIKKRMENAQDNAFELRLGRNIKGVERTIDLSTACFYFRAYDNFGNWFAVSWDESTLPRAFPHTIVRSQSFTFEEENLVELEQRGMDYFNRYCAPLISYVVEVKDLKNDPDYKIFTNNDSFRVGNKGKIWDDELNGYTVLEITETVTDAIKNEVEQVTFGSVRSFTRSTNFAPIDSSAFNPVIVSETTLLYDSEGYSLGDINGYDLKARSDIYG